MWTIVAVEGFCFGETKDGKYPCGKDCTSTLCLRNHICPHFAWAESSEREAAQFIPLWVILRDRFPIWWESLYWKVRWFFWDQLWFNQKKMMDFFNSIPVATSEEYPELKEWEDKEKEAQDKFQDWYLKVQAEEIERDAEFQK